LFKIIQKIIIKGKRMEEKSKQIQSYLQSKANPIIQPMLELMAKERPENILQWIQEYVNKKISKYLNQNLGEQS
jgi:F0F1-type ATP synthase delta subunit